LRSKSRMKNDFAFFNRAEVRAYNVPVFDKDFIAPVREDVPDKKGWLDKFPLSRRRALWEALVSHLQQLPSHVERRGVDPNRQGEWLQEYGEVSLFVKTELAPNGEPYPGGPENANPRAVNAPHDMAHHFVGRYFRKASAILHKMWHANHTIFYTGGATPEQMDSWINRYGKENGSLKGRFFDHRIVLTDYTSYDCTQSMMSLHFAERIYRRWGIQDQMFWKVLESWRQPTGRTCNGGRFRAQPMMCTGRDDTALMNAILNATAQYCSWSKVLLGVYPEEASDEDLEWLDHELRVAVLGDDSIVFAPRLKRNHEPWELDEVVAAIADFGFEAKMKAVDNIFEAVFLGCRPYPSATGLSWGPTLGRRLFKHHTVPYKPGMDAYAWLRGVSEAESIQFPHVPILREIAEKVNELLQGHSMTPFVPTEGRWVEHREVSVVPCENQYIYKCLAVVYGITRSDMEEFYRLLSQVKTLPVVLNCRAVDLCLEIDEL